MGCGACGIRGWSWDGARAGEDVCVCVECERVGCGACGIGGWRWDGARASSGVSGVGCKLGGKCAGRIGACTVGGKGGASIGGKKEGGPIIGLGGVNWVELKRHLSTYPHSIHWHDFSRSYAGETTLETVSVVETRYL
jgi:hypothetical protein